MKYHAGVNGDAFDIEVDGDEGEYRITSNGWTQNVHLEAGEERRGVRFATIADRKVQFGYTRRGDVYHITIDGIDYKVKVTDAHRWRLARLAGKRPEEDGDLDVVAPIPGRVVRIHVAEGDQVERDAQILALEAMKMENEILSRGPGTVLEVAVQEGQAVEKGDLLVRIRRGPSVL